MRRIALTLALALGLVATAQPLQIEVWHSLGDNFGAPEFEAIANRFNEVQDEIQVEVVYAGGYVPAMQRAQAALAAGNLPNVVMFEQTRGAGFVDAEAILPLDGLIAADDDFDFDDLFARLLLTCDYGGELYCMPYNNSTPLLYFNADLFRDAGLDPDAPPSTWDELHAAASALALRDGSQLTRWGIGLATSPGWLMDAFLGQAGGRFLNDDGDTFVFDGAEGVAVAEYWLRLVADDAAVAGSNQTEDFFSGRQAMILASTANLTNYYATAEFDLRATALPCHVECYAPIGGGNFYIMDVGDDALHAASWEFMKWIMSTENGAEFGAATGYMAPRRSSLEHPILVETFAERPEARITYEQMASHGYPRTLVPFWNEVHNAYGAATEEILLAGIDPAMALGDAADEANRLLRVYARD